MCELDPLEFEKYFDGEDPSVGENTVCDVQMPYGISIVTTRERGGGGGGGGHKLATRP